LFLFTFWFKDISFLTFSLWISFKKLKNSEKYILKNLKSFLKSIIFNKYGILGIKLMLKGKLFKKRRKKQLVFSKGSTNILSLKTNIKFINYNIFTRAGSYNFKCWLFFI